MFKFLLGGIPRSAPGMRWCAVHALLKKVHDLDERMPQEVSEYGSVYGSQLWKSQFSVDSQLRTQLTKQPPQSSYKGNFFVRIRFGGVPSTVEKAVRVRFCCSLTWKTNTGNTGGTVLGQRPNVRQLPWSDDHLWWCNDWQWHRVFLHVSPLSPAWSCLCLLACFHDCEDLSF